MACSAVLFLSASCGNSSFDALSNERHDDLELKQSKIEITPALLGIYHGIQPGYNIKNQFGDDLLVNGNKVPVPSIDFRFLLKENHVVSLQQKNLEDNRRVYYDGNFKIISQNANDITIECNLSDGEYSNPTYKLILKRTGEIGICQGDGDPEFEVKKIKY